MDKQELLKKYNKDEDKLLVSKILDKKEQCKRKNKIINTDFFDERQLKICKQILNIEKETKYVITGGFEEAQRNIIIFYPEKLDNIIQINNKFIQEFIQVLQIQLPNENIGKYTHRDYLSGLMKLGIKREKIGDILVEETGTDIIVSTDIIQYVKNNIEQLKRFSKSKIYINEIDILKKVTINKEEISIIIPSLRLDCMVSELARVSRSKAEELIKVGRVVVNYEETNKSSKIIQKGDILTIRGKGKYEIGEIISNTKKGKIILKVKKYK